MQPAIGVRLTKKATVPPGAIGVKVSDVLRDAVNVTDVFNGCGLAGEGAGVMTSVGRNFVIVYGAEIAVAELKLRSEGTYLALML